jgi:hypothetical protein
MDYKNYLKLMPLTIVEALNHHVKEYNPQTWEQIVKEYLQYDEVEFFERINNPNEYEQLFVKYQISEGITFFGRLSFAAGMSNGKFAMCKIENGNLMKTEHFISNNKEGRKAMSFLSKNLNGIFTNE